MRCHEYAGTANSARRRLAWRIRGRYRPQHQHCPSTARRRRDQVQSIRAASAHLSARARALDAACGLHGVSIAADQQSAATSELMRSLRAAFLALVALLFASPAFAGLSVVTGKRIGGNPPGTCAISANVGSGQAIVVMTEGSTPGSLTITDNVNSGNYSLISTAFSNMGVFWMKTNASGTPTVTLAGTTGFTFVWCFALTGFAGTPTVDTAIENTASGSSVSPAISATSNFNNEAMLVHGGKLYTESITVSGWTDGTTSGSGGGASDSSGFYAIEATSGTANNFSGSISTSQAWSLMLAGIYDLPAGSCTHAGQTSTASISVPNGSTGLYRLKNGSFGTPDCATVIYFQPTIGNFGVN